MKNKFYIIIIAILLFLNGYVVISYMNYRKINALYIKALIQEPDINTINANVKYGLENNNLYLGNIILKDTINKDMSIKSFFNKDQKYLLVCRFSKSYCASCVDYAIHSLLNWTDSIGHDNILFLGEYRNNRFMKLEMPYYDIDKFNVVNKVGLNLPIESIQYPYYFVLDSTLMIRNVFIPEKKNLGFNAKCLNIIYKRYFAKKN